MYHQHQRGQILPADTCSSRITTLACPKFEGRLLALQLAFESLWDARPVPSLLAGKNRRDLVLDLPPINAFNWKIVVSTSFTRPAEVSTSF